MIYKNEQCYLHKVNQFVKEYWQFKCLHPSFRRFPTVTQIKINIYKDQSELFHVVRAEAVAGLGLQ